MKKFLLAAVLVFIIAGAFCMSYSTEWIFDVIGAVLLVTGGVIGTVIAVKHLEKRKRIFALIALYTALVLLIAAGAFVFSWSILLAILGAGMFAVYGFLIRRE